MLQNCLKHGLDVLRRNIALDIVNGAEYESTPSPKVGHSIQYFLSYFLGRPLREDMLGVAAPTPK